MVAGAIYITCATSRSYRDASPLLDRKVRGRLPYPSIGYLLRLAVRMVVLASQ